MKFILTICTIFMVLQGYYCFERIKTSSPQEIAPGVYRIIGAEGSASVTALSLPLIPDQPDSLKKVSMTPWTSAANQEWTLIHSSTTDNFNIVNDVVSDNALSVVATNRRNDAGYTYRQWDIQELDNKNWQIKSVGTNLCLSRLGLTVYHAGSECDTQAQSQQWMFIKLHD